MGYNTNKNIWNERTSPENAKHSLCNHFLCSSIPMLGLFSSLVREQAHISHTGPKWIVLDGDIDPLWTESLNTVMDDNKVPPSCSLIKPISTWGTIAG